MAGFEDDPLTPGCYSQLLFSEEISGLETDFGFSSSFSSDDNSNSTKTSTAPKMLCFGDYAKHCNVKLTVENGSKTGQVSGSSACMDLSSEKNKINALPKSNKKRDGSGDSSGGPSGGQRNSKKSKSDNSTGHAKVVKKEKLGERITALQQLVSPFGKTDTASVLHEASGYIRFLQDQVQVLCSPYLQRSSPTASTPHGHDDGGNDETEHIKTRDLRSRGLCLVPVELTLHVADSNGADLWSSAGMVDSISTG